jgi:LPXTG-site transpeptidase (sortase) family protein
MKKFKMWYIKLAFAALFFTGIAEFMDLTVHEIVEKDNVNQTFIAGVSSIKEASAHVVHAATTTDLTLAPKSKKSTFQKNQSVTPKTFTGNNYQYQLVIPKIKVHAGVLGMGLTKEGKMAVPDNYREVGWYSLGTRPGTVGSAVLGAHVDNGSTVNGVFKNLKNLEKEDFIYMYDREGNVLQYKITEIQVLDYKTKVTDYVFARNDTSRLNLITCHGTWLPKENTYNQRLVVFAELQ